MIELSLMDIEEFMKILNIPVKVYATENVTKSKIRNNQFYILNIDDDLEKDSVGTHWTSFYLKDGICFYFDSFGNNMPERIQKLLSKKYITVYNGHQIQDNKSMACGWYAIYFIWYFDTVVLKGRNKNIDSVRKATNKMNLAIKDFDLNNIDNNEKILKGIVKRMLE